MANYGRSISQIRADLGRWEILPLSLFGRVEVIRMNVLPRLMYLFQALPIWISASRFRMLEKMVSTFIWQGKRPRIRHKTLFYPKKQGGLNLPNLKIYYWAAQLRGVVEWVLQDEETNWLKLEEQSCPLVPMETIPFLEQKKWRKLQIKNEWMNCTKRVWSLVRKKIGAPLTTSRAVKIAKDVDFLPCRLDVGFRGWMEKGLININQLFDGGTLKSFTQLQDKYGLTSKDFYRYLQLRNYLITHEEWNMLKQPPTPIEEFLIINMKEKNTRKIVSELYKCLQTH